MSVICSFVSVPHIEAGWICLFINVCNIEVISHTLSAESSLIIDLYGNYHCSIKQKYIRYDNFISSEESEACGL